MGFVWISALKDLRRLRREPVTILAWLAIPTFVAVILTLVFGPRGSGPHGTLLIVDEDRALGATMLTNAFHQGALANMLTVEQVTQAEGRRRLDRADASALIVIPAGFSMSFVTRQPVTVDLIRNPAQRVLPDIIEESLAIMLDRAASFQSASGTPAIRLEANIIADKSEQPGGFAAILLPGALFMSVFFIAGALAADMWRERTSGALRRIASTPVHFGAFVAGKLLASAVIFAVVGAFGLMAAQVLMHLQIASYPAAILWISVSGCGLYLLMMLVQSAASSERVASMLTNLVTLPLVMLGGGFIPFEWMPRGFARLGQWTPNGWCVMQLRALLAGSPHVWTFAAAIAAVAIAWLVSVRTVRRAAC
ncbi:MAG TPA: ABC transporter permease [Bryobacteraceae bacterium]|nr:ABC transporter permease [Bryobacteraceae bacterium]